MLLRPEKGTFPLHYRLEMTTPLCWNSMAILKGLNTLLLLSGINLNRLSLLLIAFRYLLSLTNTAIVSKPFCLIFFILFQIITERMKRDFYVYSRDLIHHAHCLLSEAVFLVPFTMEDKYGVMKYITFDNLRRLLPAMRSEVKILKYFYPFKFDTSFFFFFFAGTSCCCFFWKCV